MQDRSPQSILIVKTSSLGDVVQSFPVLQYLKERFPEVSIDWAISKELEGLVSSHPHIRKVIPIDFQSFRSLASAISSMRKITYDVLFDLQGNCKSGLITLLALAKKKVGFGLGSAREWPNIFATNHRFIISRRQNIRLFNLELVQLFFKDHQPFTIREDLLNLQEGDQARIEGILAKGCLKTVRIMVCPGSKWINKQLPVDTWKQFLLKISSYLNASFFFMWGSESEKKECEELCAALNGKNVLVDKLPLAVWQNLMNEMNLVLAVDSSALHFCGTTKTPSFSIFGPTSLKVFKPVGQKHLGIQGTCPYKQSFEKQCPLLRKCLTGACIRELDENVLFEAFQKWWMAQFSL